MPMNFGFRREEKLDGGLVRSVWGSMKRKPSYPAYTKASQLKSVISAPIVSDENCSEILRRHYRSATVLDVHPPSSPAPSSAIASFPPIPTRTSSSPFFAPVSVPLSSEAPAPKRKGSGISLYSLRSYSSTQLNSLGAKLSNSMSSSPDLRDFPVPPPRPHSSASLRPDIPAPAPLARFMSATTPPLAITKRKGTGSLYSLRSFSTTHLNSLGSKLSSATSSSTSNLTNLPPPSSSRTLRRARSSVRASSLDSAHTFDKTWTSSLPTSAPQLAALEWSDSFSLPLLMHADIISTRISGAIMEVEDEKAEDEEYEGTLLPLSAALDMGSRPTYIPLPATPESGGHRWSQQSNAPSYSSASESDDPLSPSSYSSSSDSSFGRCVTPDVEDVPLSPWRIPAMERRKGSVGFPSRMNASASCISLGKY